MGDGLRVLVVMDDLHAVKPRFDSSLALLGEAFARGHAVDLCRGEDLALHLGLAVAPTRSVRAVQDDLPALDGARAPQPLAGFDVILMRKNPPFDDQYFFQTLVLDTVRDACLIVNDPRALREANEKLAILDFPDVIPRTCVTRSIAQLRDFLEDCGGDIVVKPLDGYNGREVLRVRTDDQNRDALLELATRDGARLTMAQSYVPGAELGDKRVLLLAGRPIGSFIRRPAIGALRGNTRAGATLEPSPMTEGDERICRIIGPRLRERGVHFAGIDIVGGLLTEINLTSAGGIREYAHAGGDRVEGLVIDWIEATVANRAAAVA